MSKIEFSYEQAIRIIDQAASRAPLTRAEHVEVQLAVSALRELTPHVTTLLAQLPTVEPPKAGPPKEESGS